MHKLRALVRVREWVLKHSTHVFERELALLVALHGASTWKGEVEGTVRQVFIIDGRSRRKIQNYS